MDWLKAMMEAMAPETRATFIPNREFRVKANLQARVSGDQVGPVDATVVDLSRRGLKIVIPVLVEPQRDVDLQLFSQKQDKSIRLRARVVWSRRQARKYNSGLEFISFHNTRLDDVVQFFKEEVDLDVGDAEALRSPRRTLYQCPLTYQDGKTGCVLNMSHTGIRFQCAESMPSGHEVTLTIELRESNEKALVVVASVRRCRQSSPGMWDIGANMRPVDEANREVLEAVLNRYASWPPRK